MPTPINNRVHIKGNLGNSVKFSVLNNGSLMARMSVCVNRNFKKNDEWQKEAQFYFVTFFGPAVTRLQRMAEKGDLDKGSRVIVEGKISVRSEPAQGDRKAVYHMNIDGADLELTGFDTDRDNNRTQLIGNLGVAPDIRTSDSGVTYARLSVGVHDGYFDKQAKEYKQRTHWVDVTVFGDEVERCRDLKSGDRLMIAGRLAQTKREVDGKMDYSTSIVAHHVECFSKDRKLEAKAERTAGAGDPQAAAQTEKAAPPAAGVDDQWGAGDGQAADADAGSGAGQDKNSMDDWF